MSMTGSNEENALAELLPLRIGGSDSRFRDAL
jgi:hypothetical protein